MTRLWHKWVLKHGVQISKVTIGMFDLSRGELHRCECGESWAL